MTREPSFVNRLREVISTGPDAAPDPEACPTPERIYDATQGELPPVDVQEITRHLAVCPACAVEWRTAAEMDDRIGANADAGALSRRRRLPGGWLAAAALLVLAAGLAVLLPRWQQEPGRPSFRYDEERTIRSLIPDGSTLSRTGFLLRWEAVEEEALYAVQVDRDDLTPVHAAVDVSQPELLVPEEALTSLEAGAMLVWRVEARLLSGKKIRSGTFLVRLE